LNCSFETKQSQAGCKKFSYEPTDGATTPLSEAGRVLSMRNFWSKSRVTPETTTQLEYSGVIHHYLSKDRSSAQSVENHS